MSVLAYPRANFRGVFTANTPSANNDKVSFVLDEANIAIENPENKELPEEYRKWMMQTKNINGERWLNSYFNYFGDGGMTFDANEAAGMPYSNTMMTSSLLGNNESYNSETDPFLQGKVQLRGDKFFDGIGSAKMVDLDPIGIYGTQIFSGEIRVVLESDNEEAVLLSGKNPSRAYIRYMYLDRNICPNPPGAWMGGAIWQCCLPKESLTFNRDVLEQSPTLQVLSDGAKAGKGLLVRYGLYYTLDGIPEGTLADAFANTCYQDAIQNPATGMLVGTFGVWTNDDPIISLPVGRIMFPARTLQTPVSNYAFNPNLRGKSPAVEVEGDATSRPYYLPPTPVVVDAVNKKIILDFIQTIPEDTTLNPQSPTEDLHKVDYGDLRLTVTSNGVEQFVGSIPYSSYNRTAYEKWGGIVEIPVSDSVLLALADSNSILKFYAETMGSIPVMQEIDYDIIASDEQCLYLNKGEIKTYKMKVLRKGVPVINETVKLALTQYNFLTGDAGVDEMAIKLLRQLDGHTGSQYIVDIQPVRGYTTDENGDIEFSITGVENGVAMVRYQPANDNFNPSVGNNKKLYFGFVSYNAFRVMPDDNYDNLPDDEITWDLVKNDIIQYFYLMYPGMFARLPFQKEDVAKTNATIIRQMISERSWHSTSYMPVTRDLSDGKRKLLQRWCALNE